MFSFSFPLDYSAGTFKIGAAYTDILDFEVISMQIIGFAISKWVHESSSRAPHRFHLHAAYHCQLACSTSFPFKILSRYKLGMLGATRMIKRGGGEIFF